MRQGRRDILHENDSSAELELRRNREAILLPFSVFQGVDTTKLQMIYFSNFNNAVILGPISFYCGSTASEYIVPPTPSRPVVNTPLPGRRYRTRSPRPALSSSIRSIRGTATRSGSGTEGTMA